MSPPARTGRILPDLTEQPGTYTGARGGKTAPRKSKRIDDGEMRRLFAAGLDDVALSSHFGYGAASIREHRWALGLHRPRGPARGVVVPSLPTGKNSRHLAEGLAGKPARMPPFDHPALTERRTLYPSTVCSPIGLNAVLVDGHNSWKVGALVTKGRWKGFPLFTLTLEERATCPTSCVLWRSCMGNAMHLAKRIAHGDAIESRLRLEVGLLATRFPKGFAVRLHILGDFYSVAYVDLWRDLVERHAALHVFGFTARVDRADPITRAVAALVRDHWPRVALRFSNATWSAEMPLPATVTIEHPYQKPADAIVCPAQTGRTANCGSCALCWQTDRRIAFLRH